MPDDPHRIVRRFNWKCGHAGDHLRPAPGEHRVAWFENKSARQTGLPTAPTGGKNTCVDTR